jgi:hypothetical protein
VATVPVTRTWVAGEVVTSGFMNLNLTAPIGWLLAPAILRLRQTVSQNLTSGTAAAVTFDTEDVDSTGMHSTVSNTSRAVAVYPGWYRTGGGICVAANATNARAALWSVNGTNLNGGDAQIQASSSGVTCVPARSILVYLNVSDYLEEKAFQNSGTSPLATGVSTSNQSSMDLTWESN